MGERNQVMKMIDSIRLPAQEPRSIKNHENQHVMIDMSEQMRSVKLEEYNQQYTQPNVLIQDKLPQTHHTLFSFND